MIEDIRYLKEDQETNRVPKTNNETSSFLATNIVASVQKVWKMETVLTKYWNDDDHCKSYSAYRYVNKSTSIKVDQ